MLLTQKYVLKFVRFKNEIKENVDFLKYGVSMEFVSTLALLTCPHEFSKSFGFHFTIPYVVLMTRYFVWTMSSNLRIRIAENDLTMTLSSGSIWNHKILLAFKWKSSVVLKFQVFLLNFFLLFFFHREYMTFTFFTLTFGL